MTLFIVFGAKYLVAVIALAGAVGIAYAASRRTRLMLTLAIALPLGYAFARLCGFFFSHTQPFAVQGFEPILPHEIDNSFPSDHTVIGGVFASVAYRSHRLLGLGLWVLTLLVGLSRMLAGLHWGSDILAAAVLALAAVYIAEAAVARLSFRA